jgi:hypothetical protein
MEKGEYRLVWKSAQVSPDGMLTVPIMGDGTGLWQEAFKQVAEADNRALRARKWGDIGMSGHSVVHVYGLTPGNEGALKRKLDELADRANQLAAPQEKEKAAEWAEREARLLRKAKEAEEMQDRFRAA